MLKPFLAQSGFHPTKTQFVPVAAMEGINLSQPPPAASPLHSWYKGPTLVDLLGMPPPLPLGSSHKSVDLHRDRFTDALEPPTRDINAPLRFPISNVFKGATSGIAVSGRVCGGIIVPGERLRIVPGDESAVVKGDHLFSQPVLPTS